MISRQIIQQVKEETVWPRGMERGRQLVDEGVEKEKASREGFEYACDLEVALLIAWLPVADFLEEAMKKRPGLERNGALRNCNPARTITRKSSPKG